MRIGESPLGCTVLQGFLEESDYRRFRAVLLDHVVFAAAAAAGAQRVVHVSSACVYPVDLQTSENRLLPREEDAGFDAPGKAFADGEYGWAKLMGELRLTGNRQAPDRPDP